MSTRSTRFVSVKFSPIGRPQTFLLDDTLFADAPTPGSPARQPRWGGLVAGDKVMIVWWDMKAGAHAAAHKHPHEQVFWMLSGRMDFRLGDEKRTCVAGDLAVIPGGVEHEAWFPEDTQVIDVFAPPREDFLGGETPAYMKKD